VALTFLVTGDVIHGLNGTPIESLNRLRSGLDILNPTVCRPPDREGRQAHVRRLPTRLRRDSANYLAAYAVGQHGAPVKILMVGWQAA